MGKDVGTASLMEIVIIFGLLSGMGAEPVGAISNALAQGIQPIAPGFVWLFVLIPYVAAVVELAAAYGLGGILGLFAVGLAFPAGLLGIDSLVSPYLIVIALLLAFVAPYMKN